MLPFLVPFLFASVGEASRIGLMNVATSTFLDLTKIGQVVNPFRNPIGNGRGFRNMIDMWDRGMITRPLYQSKGGLPVTDWAAKNKALSSTSKTNPWDDVYGILPPELRAQMPHQSVDLPPLPILRHGPGGARFAALAKSWGASPELVKSLAPPHHFFNRAGERIR